MRLAVDVSAERTPLEVLRRRGADVLIARVPIPDAADRSVVVKLWNRPGLRGFLRRLSRTHISRREFETLKLLRAQGLPVPEPCACLRLRDPAARHTEALIEEDLGRCGDTTEQIKLLIRKSDEAGLRRFEDDLIETTAAMVRAGLIDTDHRLPNFVTLPSGRPVRLDFELARRVRAPMLWSRAYGVMLGTLVGSHAFAVQPDTSRTKAFAHRLAERLKPPARALAAARNTVTAMLARQQREAGIDTRVELNW